jgi:hypothetical protein
MSDPLTDRRIFSLTEAHELLPTIRALTADAVRNAEQLTAELDAVETRPETAAQDDERERLSAQLNGIVADWAGRISQLGLEAKGPWLVDFDTGSGYYCWRYPEDAVSHFHGYEDGFAGRMKIV